MSEKRQRLKEAVYKLNEAVRLDQGEDEEHGVSLYWTDPESGEERMIATIYHPSVGEVFSALYAWSKTND